MNNRLSWNVQLTKLKHILEKELLNDFMHIDAYQQGWQDLVHLDPYLKTFAFEHQQSL